MAAFAVCSFALAGLPLLAGFLSKWNLGVGAVHTGQPLYLGVLVASGVLNFAYFFPIVHAAYFGGSAGSVQYDDNGPAMTAPLAITAMAAIALGVFPDAAFSLYRLAWMAAAGVTGAGAGATP